VRVLRWLASRELMLLLLGGWVLLYVSYSVWSQEALATFMKRLGSDRAFQVPFALLLLSLTLQLLKGLRRQRGLLRRLLWAPLPLGVLVFLTGVLLSAVFRLQEWRLLGEGDFVSPPWQTIHYRLERIEPALKEETLQSVGATPQVFQYEPKVLLSTEGERFSVGVFPPRRIHGTYYHILDFGLAPRVRFFQGHRLKQEGYLALRLLPPGARDSFRVSFLPYAFNIRIVPQEVLKEGKEEVAVYNLRRPTYELEVLRGDELVLRARSAQEVAFEGLRVQFLEPSYWVVLEMVRDPGLLPMAAGLALFALGIPLRAALGLWRLLFP
jgi:hypothetical protein